MDYKRMMMETPEETMKRFERKRKLKEVLCEFGLVTHKVRLGNTTQFAFALGTPTGTPIARPCSSEDLAECSQWLASKYPAHFFFQGADQRPSVYETQGATGSDAGYGITTRSESKALQYDVTDQLIASTKTNADFLPTSELRSYDRIYGSIRDEHPNLAVEKHLHELDPSELRRVEDQRDDARHCERSTPLEIIVSPWDTPPRSDSPNTKRPTSCGRIWHELRKAREGSGDRIKPERRSGGHGHGHEQFKRSRVQEGCHRDREMGHTERREQGGDHGEHRHGTEHRKDRSVANRHHASRDGTRARGRSRRGRTGITNQNQTSKSDERSGICGQEIYGPTRERLDPTSRLTARLMNVEKWDYLKQSAGSSDTSLSPEPWGSEGLSPATRSHRNGIRRHPKNGVPFYSRHDHRAPPTTDHFQYMPEGVDARARENQSDYPECDIAVADEDLIHPGVKGEKKPAWKPSPLYRASVTSAPEKSESSFDSVCTSANDQGYDAEACEREERALIRYLRLFADDQSWKEGFESPDGLTCDVCNLEGRIKRVPDVKALVSHAKTMKRGKMAEHRGYARAICELMNFDVVALDQVNKATDRSGSKRPTDDTIVWPPVLVLENTRTEKGPDGQWKSVDEGELTEVLEVALAHKGNHTFRPICGKNGHKGRVLVEFPPSRQAWVDTTTLHKQFKMNARGYTEWLAVKPRWRNLGPDSIKDGTDFVRLDDTGNPKRVLYGYLAEPRHMEVFDPSRKYVQNWKIASKKIIL